MAYFSDKVLKLYSPMILIPDHSTWHHANDFPSISPAPAIISCPAHVPSQWITLVSVHTGLWLAGSDHVTWTLASDWSVRRAVYTPHATAWQLFTEKSRIYRYLVFGMKFIEFISVVRAIYLVVIFVIAGCSNGNSYTATPPAPPTSHWPSLPSCCPVFIIKKCQKQIQKWRWP